jgi:integrating conjugative element protein (TIGR03752 family)
MAEKRMNPLLIGAAALAIACLSLVMCSEPQARYQRVDQMPGYDAAAKPQDGDTQTDTIKALQAYAREAVKKAESLNASTKDSMGKVLENQHKVSQREASNRQAQNARNETKATIDSLQQHLSQLKGELSDLRDHKGSTDIGQFNHEGLPLGFGFDGQKLIPVNPDQGAWYHPIDYAEPEMGEESKGRFTGLLPRSRKTAHSDKLPPDAEKKKSVVVEPVYTIPKDATLMDGLALTALIGRIPVEGQAPDPYPVKIYIGKDNLLANGHELPEIEGMIFSGLGFGDWNLSCVSARLTSATFIFEDGSIVNHSSQGQPLGYISDPSGVPCVAGRFVTNAASFIGQRIGLAGLGAAGAAYADAQQQRQTSSLTGSTTSAVVGNINKLAAGKAVQSATDEVSRWLLARQQQSFDAVVVNPGVEVSVHLDRNLSLDKHSIARRLRYAKNDADRHADLD